nr:rhodanese-like domain-containing protein [uncultured Marinifilum sp.]
MTIFSNNDTGLKTSYSAIELMNELQKRDDILLIDIREPNQLAKNGIENAIHIPMEEIQNKIPMLPKDKDIVVFCHLGFRSKQVRNYLRNIGFYNVAHLKGGLYSWNRNLKQMKASEY